MASGPKTGMQTKLWPRCLKEAGDDDKWDDWARGEPPPELPCQQTQMINEKLTLVPLTTLQMQQNTRYNLDNCWPGGGAEEARRANRERRRRQASATKPWRLAASPRSSRMRGRFGRAPSAERPTTFSLSG